MFNYRKLLPIVGALAAITFTLPTAADAASGSGKPPLTAWNPEDLLYDFEVYIAENVTMYHLIVYYPDGTSASYYFETLEEAEEYEASLRILNVYPTEIIEEVVQGPWEYLITYDKRETAEAIADYAEALGYYAKVKRVSIFSHHLVR